MTLIAQKIYTVEEYFELERHSEVRHEFVYGQLIPMSGESRDANRIALNIYTMLNPVLEALGYEIYLHDVKTMVEESGIYRYPDLVVTPESDDEDTHVVKKPVLVAEVLSHNTAGVDRYEKLRQYCNMPTLQYYLIIEQDEPQIEMYVREGDTWEVRFFDASDKVIKLDKFETEISIKAMYRRVKFK